MGDSIFDRCPPDVKKHVLYRQYQPSDILLLQGQQEDCAYFLLRGAVRVFKLLDDGSCVQIGFFKSGSFIGNIELFAHTDLMNMVEAAEPCTVACIPLDAFYHWLDSDTVLCRQLLEDMAVQIVAFNRQIMLGKSLTRQEHFYLLLLRADSAGQPLTKQLLQDQLSASLRTVNRLLQKAAREGLVRVENGQILLLDREKLIALHNRCDTGQ